MEARLAEDIHLIEPFFLFSCFSYNTNMYYTLTINTKRKKRKREIRLPGAAIPKCERGDEGKIIELLLQKWELILEIAYPNQFVRN